MYHSHSVLESMCRLSVAPKHDASREREMLLRTAVLMRRRLQTVVPPIMAVRTTVLICQIQRTIVPDRLIRGTTVPSHQKDVLSDLMCPTRTGYGMSSLDDYGMATGRRQLGRDHVL